MLASHTSYQPDATIDALRVPPQSVSAEQAVLGGIMLDPAAYDAASDILTEDDFYRRDHKLIFRAIKELKESNRPFDAVTLGEWFEANNLTEQIGRSGYLIELASTTPSAANVSAYADIVREKSILRQLIDAGSAITDAGFSGNKDEAYALAVSRISAIEPRISADAPPPTDLFGEYPPPVLKRDFIPPAIADFVFQAAEVKSCHPETLFVSALSACAAATSDAFQVQPRPNEPLFRESARLWVMVVGDPSKKKTPAMKLAMSGLSDMNADMIYANAKAEAAFDEQMQVFKLAQKKAAKAKANGDGDPEPTSPPERPRHERIITSDFTVEGIARLLTDNPRGILAYTDELATWFGKMGKYSAGGSGDDRAQWLQFYDGGRKPIDRAGRTVLIENASVSVIGAIQPDLMRALASTMSNDGLLQRFIISVLPNTPLPDCEKPEPTHLIRAYADLITQIYKTTPPQGPGLVPMSDEAVEVRRELDTWRRMIAESDGLPGMLRSAVVKYEGLFGRLCMVYHMIGCAQARIYPTSLPIAGSTAARVADLIRYWIFPNALAFYTGVMGSASPGFTLARAVADYLLASEDTRITRRNITHGCGMWRNCPEWQQQAALASLEQAGWLIPAAPSDGRQAKSWTINPRVRVEFAARAEQARIRRAEISRVLAEMREAAEEKSRPLTGA